MTAQGGDPAGMPKIPDRKDADLPLVWSPDPYPIAIGLGIIASIYLLPVFPAPGTGFLPLADALANASTGSFFSNPMLLLTFWLGWGASLGLVIYGLILKKPDISFKRT